MPFQTTRSPSLGCHRAIPSLLSLTLSLPAFWKMRTRRISSNSYVLLLATSPVNSSQSQIFLRLNPFLMLFDPSLHSMDYIRARSPFLFTCMLTEACKLWRHDLYKACLELTRAFIPLAFDRQWRSVEVVQAFLFLSFYPESEDNVSVPCLHCPIPCTC